MLPNYPKRRIKLSDDLKPNYIGIDLFCFIYIHVTDKGCIHPYWHRYRYYRLTIFNVIVAHHTRYCLISLIKKCKYIIPEIYRLENDRYFFFEIHILSRERMNIIYLFYSTIGTVHRSLI